MKRFTHRLIILAVMPALCLSPLLAVADSTPQDDAKPNILFLLTDDQRWDTLGVMGNSIIQTPRLDTLARDGVVFEYAFVTTSICSVSRASFFAGQYARRHGIHDFATPFSEEALAKTYPHMLREQGYRIGFIGKWGVGRPPLPENEFDYWKGFPGQGRFFEKDDPKHLTARMGDQALEFFKTHDRSRPFCLSISFKAPHAQDGAPREFPPDPRDENLYADVVIPVAKTDEKYFQAQPEFVHKSEGRTRWQRRFATPDMAQNTLRDYYRLITGVDREVGRMLEALEELGLAENTIVIFTSDNGFYLGEYGLAGKWLMHEESIRVPLIVHDPRLPQHLRGRRLNEMALNIDVAPTVLEYAGITAPASMQGASLVPLVQNQRTQWRTDWFYEHHFHHGGRIPQTEGVRTERWKYVRYISADPVVEELFDLRRDPQETRNLAENRRHQRRLNQLRARWAEFREILE